MELPKRKPNRLRHYSYNNTGAYFITICTRNKEKILWNTTQHSINSQNTVGASIARQPEYELSLYGKIVNSAINNIPSHYPKVSVDNYVIMPNHIHLLLQIHVDVGRAMLAPTVSEIVRQTKGIITKQIGYPIFQRSFHDHIIRNRNDYLNVWTYIDNNPIYWENDVFHC